MANRPSIPATLGLLALLCPGAATPLFAADRFVATTGSDMSNDCLNNTTPCLTVAYALTQALSGDTIKIAEGVYTDVAHATEPLFGQPASRAISGNTTLVISGGWESDFGSQSPLLKTSIRAPQIPLPQEVRVNNVQSIDS